MSLVKSQIIPDRAQSIRLTLQTLQQAIAAYQRYQGQILRGEDITPTQFTALHVLYQSREPMVLTTLAQNLSITKGTLSSLLKRLERKGWVERLENREDGRSSRVCLSPQGRGLMEHLMAKYIDQEREALLNLESSELDLLRVLLYKLEQSFLEGVRGIETRDD